MKVEIINTGSELLLGRTLNTHQQWLCRRLADQGWTVPRQTAVPDTATDICAAVREALRRAPCVIVTGGLGPTSDDLTREEISRLLGRELSEDAAVVAALKQFYAARGRVMPARARVQAMVPAGATVLPNNSGTAPGLAMKLSPNPFQPEAGDALLVMLPGPPRELRPMFNDSVLPLLGQAFPQEDPYVCATLRTTGLPESDVEGCVAGPLSDIVTRGLQIGYCARPGEVDVRLSARGGHAGELVAQAASTVRRLCAAHLYTEAEEDLEAVVIALLQREGRSLAVAESCTGGLIAHRLTNLPGASTVLRGGVVAYANDAKRDLLGVPAALLDEHGAVSEPVCAAMAEGVRRRFGADLGISVTGIAGPGGGTGEKPVGTVFIGLATADGTQVLRRLNRWDRQTFKQVTSQQALDMVRRAVLGIPLG